jgi:urea transport system substrate-binding protein
MVEGDDGSAFYNRLRAAGITPERLPVISLCLSEEAVRRMAIADVVGQYAAWNYFQSIDRPENQEFVRKFKARYGANRVVDDNIQIAYQSVWLWAQTAAEIEDVGVQEVRDNILRQSMNAPEGIISIDAETRHSWRPFFLGKVRPDGQFEIVWSVARSIRPVPYPPSRRREQWDALVRELKDR